MVVPPGPPSLQIVEPQSGDCEVLDLASSLRVHIEAPNFTLRPPGLCTARLQCGHIAFFVGDKLLARSASRVTDVPFGALEQPEGTHTLRVELHDDEGNLALDADGHPLAAGVEVETRVIDPDAGPDAGSPCDDDAG